MVSRELDDPVDSETNWTAGTTILKYIRNVAKRFHMFVANRVQSFRDQTNPAQWRYVESKNNPPDDALCGLKGHQLSDNVASKAPIYYGYLRVNGPRLLVS